MAPREREKLIQRWNWISTIAYYISPFVDLLFLYIPVIDDHNKCLDFNYTMTIVLFFLRSVLHILYFPSLILHFTRPSKSLKIRGAFFVTAEMFALLPVTKLIVFGVYAIYSRPYVLIMTMLSQSLVRLLLRNEKMDKDLKSFVRLSPTLVENIYCCILLSHLVGAFWYWLSIVSELSCWVKELNADPLAETYVTCGNLNQTVVSRLNNSCSFTGSIETFHHGIFINALKLHLIKSSTGFFTRLFYSFWWGLHNLSSFGLNLEPSTDLVEELFAWWISICGLVFLALLLVYLKNLNQLTEEKRKAEQIKEDNIEAWMPRQNLPKWFSKTIRQHDDYKLWESTWFADEETLICNFSKDIGRDLKRHLRWFLVIKVPQFTRLMLMDRYFLDALCDKLKPVFYVKKTCILREGEPIGEMILIKQGNLKTKEKDTQRPGFYKYSNLKDGDFCGEELVTWALDPNSSSHILPISTQTVETISEVEAYALLADDFKFTASRLHTSYSSRLCDWQRTWAARKIQKAWFHHKKMKMEQSLSTMENSSQSALVIAVETPSLASSTVYTPQTANVLRNRQIRESSDRIP